MAYYECLILFHLAFFYVLHLFHLEHSSMLLSQHACSGYKKQTRVIMRIGILRHSFSCLGTDTNATQSVPSPCEWRRAMSSTETPQCLWHTLALRTVSLSVLLDEFDSVSNTAQLFTQTFQRRSQRWCKDTKSCLNRMQEIPSMISFKKNIHGYLMHMDSTCCICTQNIGKSILWMCVCVYVCI